MSSPSRPDIYCVPRRFGIGAILAFTTLFACVLGALRPHEPPPWVYAMIGALGLTVCIAQIVTQDVPRLVSIAAGAIALPVCLAFGFSDRVFHSLDTTVSFVIGLPCMALAGGFFGYLTGAVSAGVFLVGDMLEDRVRRRGIVNAEIVTEPEGVPATGTPEPILAEAVAVFTADSCTPYLGPAAAAFAGPAASETTMSKEHTRVQLVGAPESIPVYNCIALVAPRDAQGIVHVRAANVADLRTSGASEREALQHLVGAFKIIVAQALAAGRPVPLLDQPHAAASGEQTRFIAVHL